MRVSDKAIVLQSIKHSDNKFIIKLYTYNFGLLTAGAALGRSAGSKVKAVHLFPLSIIDVELIVKQNREVQQLTEAAGHTANQAISGSLAKLSIAQFMNEVLIKCLKEQHPNHHLFEFIETCLGYLNDSEENYVNLHLYFLTELTRYLGFEPQNNYSLNEPYFDCRNGGFSPMSLAFPLGLNKEDSFLLAEFLKINCLQTSISNKQRSTLLEILITYYRLHLPGFTQINSIEVLKEVMSV